MYVFQQSNYILIYAQLCSYLPLASIYKDAHSRNVCAKSCVTQKSVLKPKSNDELTMM